METESRSGLTVMDDFTGRETATSPFRWSHALVCLFVGWRSERGKKENVQRVEVGVEKSDTEIRSGLKVMDDFTGRETQPQPPFVGLTRLFVCWMVV